MAQTLSEASEPLNVLWYGDGGMGKTTHLASMAHLGRVLLINAESGVKGSALKRRGIPIENIEIYPGPGEELSYAGIEEQWFRVREDLNKDPESWAGVGWDSITEIQQTLKDKEVAAAVVRATRKGLERSPFVVDQDNWRSINEQCRGLIRKFRDLPCHFGMTALQRREQDGDGTVVYLPSVTPGIQGDLIGWVDLVCHCSVEVLAGEEEYRGLFRPHGKYRGKDRFNITPKWIVDPTFDRVLEYVEGELTLDTDDVMELARDRAERDRAALAA